MKYNYDLIKSLRLKSNLTQEQLAEKLFIHRTSYSKFERGITKTDIPRLEQLALIFDVRIEEFFQSSVKASLDNISKKDIVAKLYQFSIESLIYSSYTIQTNSLETYPLSFEEYLKDEVLNPDFVVKSIIQDLQNYYSEDPELKDELDFIYNKEDIELLAHKTKSELHAFARKKDNYQLSWNILYQPYTYKKEDSQKAFNELVSKNLDIKLFFEFGLVTDSFFMKKWKRFIQQNQEREILAEPIIKKEEIQDYLSTLESINVIKSNNGRIY